MSCNDYDNIYLYIKMEKLQELPKDIQKYILKYLEHPKPEYINELERHIRNINIYKKIHYIENNIFYPSLILFFIDITEYNDGLFLKLYN